MWNTTAKPSIALSNRGVTASGVTSRPVRPVPPVRDHGVDLPDRRSRPEPRRGSGRRRRARSRARRAHAPPPRPLRQASRRTCRPRACGVSDTVRTAIRTGTKPVSLSPIAPGPSRSAARASIQRAPVRPMLALPEGRLGLQPVHHVIDRVEGGAAVLRRGGDEDDRLARRERAVAVDDDKAGKAEARARILADRRDRLLGEAGIMIELERGRPGRLALGADQAGEGGDRASARTRATVKAASSAPGSNGSAWIRIIRRSSAAGRRSRRRRRSARCRGRARH